ncbi:ABC transporter substrate-binding protein [Shinella granuli]|uniref:Amino acid/amide ABC transporter substrate-binding protein (HAAT family) n=1 Tax=Shinella granuli TaxID=323621 RepID=A0A4R2CDU1_SHIGR|nr:ABC transporter substrate-binding protein [Shinella granuli]TCN38938.1 amino acid/amide ABC transporter substrate-binding protein (HAAT family) [Shinella granuli]
MNSRGYTRRTILRTGVMAGGALALPGLLSRRSHAQSQTIRIGFVSPRTGPVAAFGASDDYVLKQVRAAIGAGIEIDGITYPVEIIVKDTQSNPNRAAEVANQLMLEDEVDLMLASSTADTTNPVADQCELNEMPCISTDTPWDGHFFGRGGDPSTGFDWTYHFFWGAGQLVDCYTSLWDQLSTNKKVGVLWSNDSDGVPLSSATTGLPPLFAKNGYEVVDAGFHQPLSDDFSAQIAKLKAAGVDIVSGVFLPPDFTTFWTQAAQQGFRPKAVTVAKALLFPSAVETLGGNGNGVSSEVWWSPNHPYTSGLTGISSADLARGYEAESGQQWIQPTGYKHALLEVAIDVLKRSGNPKDKGAVLDAITRTDYKSIVGPISWANGPVKNACQTPLVGGQWLAGSGGTFDLSICENKSAPEIAVQKAFAAL